MFYMFFVVVFFFILCDTVTERFLPPAQVMYVSMTVKTDDITGCKREVDVHRQLWVVQV